MVENDTVTLDRSIQHTFRYDRVMSNKNIYLCIGGCCLTLGKLHLETNNNRVFLVKICVDQGKLVQGGMFFKVFEVYMSLLNSQPRIMRFAYSDWFSQSWLSICTTFMVNEYAPTFIYLSLTLYGK